jgi:dsDNA-specific endonuclease/ATPase MutS2
MLLKNALKEISGLRFMIGKLAIQSSAARHKLYNTAYKHDGNEIAAELDKIAFFYRFISEESNRQALENIRLQLRQVKDLRGTITRIRETQVLDDIELFEIKAFALLTETIAEEMEKNDIHAFPLPPLHSVIDLLDPEQTHIPHFYIYDAYSPALSELRKRIRNLKRKPHAAGKNEDMDELFFQSLALEDEIRKEISLKLNKFGEEIALALQRVTDIDLLIAKAQQAIDMHLQKPSITSGTIRYTGIFNPEIQNRLRSEGKTFQPVDLEIPETATLITGANMTGKSVLLKTLALAQALFQFGFYIPAASADMVCVDAIRLCMGDEQDALRGLSSFASEMLNINRIVEEIKVGVKPLVLIDEPARTTNPAEGAAIVNAVVDFLTKHKTCALVTTHYSGIYAGKRRLRVKGFREEQVNEKLTIENINQYIDYSLTEENGDIAPREAIRIARILGIEKELLNSMEEFVNYAK